MYCGDLKGREVQKGAGIGSGYMYMLEKEMAIHFSTFAWEIPWTEEPVGHDLVTKQQTYIYIWLIHFAMQ